MNQPQMCKSTLPETSVAIDGREKHLSASPSNTYNPARCVREAAMASVRRKKIHWTREDVKVLRSLAGRHTAARIARKLKRTVLAVRFKTYTHRISLALKHAR
jgi:hypothetical protein